MSTHLHPSEFCLDEDEAAKRVIEGMGCFKSKAGAQVMMSRDYKLPPELNLLSYRSVVIE